MRLANLASMHMTHTCICVYAAQNIVANTAGVVAGVVVALVIIIVIGIFIYLIVVRGWRPGSGKEAQSSSGRSPEFPPPKDGELTHAFTKAELPQVVRTNRANSDLGFSDQWDNLSPVGRTQSTSEANRHCNSDKNRYGNIHPYDHSIVKLTTGPVGVEGAEYINANWLPGHTHSKEYIATQGPLPSTRSES